MEQDDMGGCEKAQAGERAKLSAWSINGVLRSDH